MKAKKAQPLCSIQTILFNLCHLVVNFVVVNSLLTRDHWFSVYSIVNLIWNANYESLDFCSFGFGLISWSLIFFFQQDNFYCILKVQIQNMHIKIKLFYIRFINTFIFLITKIIEEQLILHIPDSFMSAVLANHIMLLLLKKIKKSDVLIVFRHKKKRNMSQKGKQILLRDSLYTEYIFDQCYTFYFVNFCWEFQ